jgi:ketosteroid isomerase-like protein
MTTRKLPPTAIALEFVDRINRGDLEGLVAMMSEDHRLEVFDEEPVVGRAANASAWRGYMTAFPLYVIYPRRINANGEVVAILGHTTGSHLDIPESEERELLLIWLAYVRDGAVERWRLIGDSPANRKQFGLNG